MFSFKKQISAEEEILMPRSPSSIKKEPERMEIVKRRMVESQREMEGWPMTRRDFKVEGKRDYGSEIDGGSYGRFNKRVGKDAVDIISDPDGIDGGSIRKTANNNVRLFVITHYLSFKNNLILE